MPAMNPNDLTGHGLPGLVCQEIAKQVTAGTANAGKLAAAGMPTTAAQKVATLIQGGESTAKNLGNAINKHQAS